MAAEIQGIQTIREITNTTRSIEAEGIDEIISEAIQGGSSLKKEGILLKLVELNFEFLNIPYRENTNHFAGLEIGP